MTPLILEFPKGHKLPKIGEKVKLKGLSGKVVSVKGRTVKVR